MKKYSKQAWYFPNWHADKLNDMWHGKGWTEWQVAKYATPKFEGHYQPKIPVWGYEDESLPEVMEKKIKVAKEHGFDGFIFDFYWFKELGPYRRNCLEKGFLGAKNNEEMEFSIMWANHHPICAHPAPKADININLADASIDEDFFYEVTDYCIRNYFPKKNYRRVDGKCYFGVWSMGEFAKSMGGYKRAGDAIKDFRARAKEAGFDIHFAANVNGVPGFDKRETEEDREKFNLKVRMLGIDSIFMYGWTYPDYLIGDNWPIVDYEEYRDYNLARYQVDSEFSPIPLDIAMSTGWDSSPRTIPSDIYDKGGYARSYITVNNTPEQIEKAFVGMKEFADSDKFTGNMVSVCWNEWTEGNCMEPNDKYGYGYLQAFKKVFK